MPLGQVVNTIDPTYESLTVTSGVTAADLTVTDAVAFSGATVSDLGTVTTADIDGGTIDGATIGGSSAAAGTFTGITVSGTVAFSGATVSNLGTVTTADIDGGTIDGTVLGGASAAAATVTTLTASSTVRLDDTTDATDGTGGTGALGVDGGASIAKSLYVGSALSVAGNLSMTAGTVLYSASAFSIYANTSDGSDNKSLLFAGGGSATASRGAFIAAYGNEYGSGVDGWLELSPGDASGGKISLRGASGERASVADDGLTLGTSSQLDVQATTASTTTTTGCAIFAGGIGVAGRASVGNLTAADNVLVGDTTSGSGAWGDHVVVGASGGDKCIMGNLSSTGVVYGAHSTGVNAWAACVVAGSSISLSPNTTEAFKADTSRLTCSLPIQLKSYTVAGLPTGAAGDMAYCSDETGGAVPVFSDGTNWRRVTDRAVAS